jgi:hypothetical protein
LPALAVLQLHSAGLSGGGHSHVFAAHLAATLRRLDVAHDHVGDAIEVLAHRDDPCALRELALAGNGITDAGATALAGSVALPALEKLDLDDNKLTRAGVVALANRTGLPALTELRLMKNPLPSGRYERREYHDGITYTWEDVEVPLSRDEVRALFADHPKLTIP